MADASKAKGNAAFAQGDLPLALAHYSTAIHQDPSQFLYPLNRALVHLKLQRWSEAEKDASLALKLMPNQPKALFRRGLARKQLGKVARAREDFLAAKKAGAGDEADRELAALGDGSEEAKSSTSPATPPSAAKSPAAASAPSPKPSPPPAPPSKTQTRTERLQAALSGPSSSSTSSAAPPASSSPSTPAPSALKMPSTPPVDGMMQAVSTRKLNKSTEATSSSSSFAAKKAEREAKSRGAFGAAAAPARDAPPRGKEAAATPTAVPFIASIETPSAPPSPASTLGSNPTSSPSPRPPPASATPIAAALPAAPRPPTSMASTTTPKTAAAFEHAFHNCKTSAERLSVLKSLPLTPASLPTLFGSSLTPDLLSLIISTLIHSSFSSAEAKAKEEEEDVTLLEWKLPFLRAMMGVPRFATVVGFLDEGERDGIRSILKSGKEALERLEKGWDV